MKKIIIIIIIFIIVITVILVSRRGNSNTLGSDTARQNTTEQVSPNPTLPKPQTFQFDSSTDLGAELEKVDPKVLDSDFE